MISKDVFQFGKIILTFWNKDYNKYWRNEPLGITIDFDNKRLVTLLKR